MNKITKPMLLRAVPSLYIKRADEFVASFNQWNIPFGIDNEKRIVHYLAQVFHESGALRYVEEIASGAQYEGRKDLGNTQQGDGVRFKGRGFIQLTGRTNYTKFNEFDLCTEDVVTHPEKVAEFPLNQIASMWFWQTHGLNELADRDDGGKIGEDIVTRITKIINGGTNHLSERKYFYRCFKREFGL
jgi:putative chitinase